MAFDRNASAQITRLREYIATDEPRAGLSFATKSDVDNAAIMNAPSTAVTRRLAIGALDLVLAVDVAEYVALTQAQQRAWQAFLAAVAATGSLDMNNVRAVAHVSGIWPALTAPNTRTALVALANKANATHAEALFGDGTRLDHLDVAVARSA